MSLPRTVNGLSRRQQAVQKSRKKTADRRTAYWLVDMRDKGCCRACGVATKFSALGDPKRRDHHHIRGRQMRDSETTANICILCGTCHDLRHVQRTLVITGNADSVLEFELDGKVWRG